MYKVFDKGKKKTKPIDKIRALVYNILAEYLYGASGFSAPCTVLSQY